MPPASAKVILLMGQSNMAGMGAVDAANSFVPDKSQRAHIWNLSSGATWVNPAVEPLHVNDNATGVGPGLFCADALAIANPSETYALIPAAYGGSSMSSWTPSGNWYLRCLGMVGKMMSTSDAKVSHALFYQGEANADTRANADAWAPQFTMMANDLQAYFPGIQIVFAQLALLGSNVTTKPYWDSVKAAQAGISLPGVTMIRTDDITSAMLPNPNSPVLQADGIHLTTGAYKVVGERFAAAI